MVVSRSARGRTDKTVEIFLVSIINTAINRGVNDKAQEF
jgi:hypothetical protein